MKYTKQFLGKSMRLLAPVILTVAFMVMGAGVSVYGESPIIFDDGSVHTAILLTPEFEVDATEFDSTGEIILDVRFEGQAKA